MCFGIDRRHHQSSGAQLHWECPRGHEESDDTPVPKSAYCQRCDRFYEWADVTQLGPARQAAREAMPAGLAR